MLPKNPFTPRQGQYLAFIFYYTRLHGYPPAEADMQKYFKTTAPTVHDMIVRLEKKGLVEKQPYKPRSLRLLIAEEEIPMLKPLF